MILMILARFILLAAVVVMAEKEVVVEGTSHTYYRKLNLTKNTGYLSFREENNSSNVTKSTKLSCV